MNLIKKSLFWASLIGFGLPSFATWEMVSTFDDDSSLELVTDQGTIPDSNAHSEIVDGKLALFPGDLFKTTSNLWTTIDLGVDLKQASIDSGKPITLYFEIEQPLIEGKKAIVDTQWGLSNEEEEDILTVRVDSFNVLQRLNSTSDEYQARNGSYGFETIATFEAGVTYSIWLVVDYALNYYDTYIKGGAFTELTRIGSTGNSFSDVWLFRNDPHDYQTVDQFLISSSRGNSIDGEKGIDPVYFDTLAVDTSGENLTVPARSEWNIVSTFDDDSALGLVTDQETIAGSNAHSEIVDGKLALYPGDLFETTSNLWTTIDLGVDLKQASIDSGKPITLFFQVEQPLIEGKKAIVDAQWGLSNEEEEDILTVRSDSFNVMQRLDSTSDEYQARNGSYGFETIATFEAGVTYSVWLVVDYTLNYYNTYIKGGVFTEVTRIGSTGNSFSDAWLFRKDPVDYNTVDQFLISLSRGNSVDGEKGVDPIYFDMFAVDLTGKNLNLPRSPVIIEDEIEMAPGVFGNYEINSDHEVNTGDWIGWINAANYPWIWSYSLNRWIFTGDGDKDAQGAWLYPTK